MLSIILPVYNEENAILSTVERIKEVMNRVKTKYEIIAVNDGSTDNTGEILKKIKVSLLITKIMSGEWGIILILFI